MATICPATDVLRNCSPRCRSHPRFHLFGKGNSDDFPSPAPARGSCGVRAGNGGSNRGEPNFPPGRPAPPGTLTVRVAALQEQRVRPPGRAERCRPARCHLILAAFAAHGDRAVQTFFPRFSICRLLPRCLRCAPPGRGRFSPAGNPQTCALASLLKLAGWPSLSSSRHGWSLMCGLWYRAPNQALANYHDHFRPFAIAKIHGPSVVRRNLEAENAAAAPAPRDGLRPARARRPFSVACTAITVVPFLRNRFIRTATRTGKTTLSAPCPELERRDRARDARQPRLAARVRIVSRRGTRSTTSGGEGVFRTPRARSLLRLRPIPRRG